MRMLLAALLLSACGDDGISYSSFQECFDKIDMTQSRRVSITNCCDRTIGGATDVCGPSATTCASYVTSNLEPTSASQTEITEGCDDYAMQLGN